MVLLSHRAPHVAQLHGAHQHVHPRQQVVDGAQEIVTGTGFDPLFAAVIVIVDAVVFVFVAEGVGIQNGNQQEQHEARQPVDHTPPHNGAKHGRFGDGRRRDGLGREGRQVQPRRNLTSGARRAAAGRDGRRVAVTVPNEVAPSQGITPATHDGAVVFVFVVGGQLLEQFFWCRELVKIAKRKRRD